MPGKIQSSEYKLGTHRTLLQEFWRNFRRNRLSLIGGAIVLFYAFLASFAPLIAPYDPIEQFDAPGGMRNPMPPLSRDAGGRLFLLGTDKFGRDILSRAIYGTRSLLEVAVGSISVAMLIGVTMGAIAGYKAGTWVDELLMRAVDIMLSFPSLVLAIALVGAFGIGKIKVGPVTLGNTVKIILLIAITYSPRFARLMRAVVLQEMAKDYVAAAKAIGASSARIVFREILPNTIPPVIVRATLMMATTVLTASSLSFLGLGFQPPRPSLGLMLNEARGYLFWGAWWYAVVPGGLISLAILGFNLLGDGLRDALDPRLAGMVRK